MKRLSNWVAHKDRKYTQAAQDEFFRITDYHIVAQAHSDSHCVVTLELPAPEAKKRIHIPDACRGLNVPYSEPFVVYRKLGLHFS
jgi:hypothetical protein